MKRSVRPTSISKPAKSVHEKFVKPTPTPPHLKRDSEATARGLVPLVKSGEASFSEQEPSNVALTEIAEQKRKNLEARGKAL